MTIDYYQILHCCTNLASDIIGIIVHKVDQWEEWQEQLFSEAEKRQRKWMNRFCMQLEYVAFISEDRKWSTNRSLGYRTSKQMLQSLRQKTYAKEIKHLYCDYSDAFYDKLNE